MMLEFPYGNLTPVLSLLRDLGTSLSSLKVLWMSRCGLCDLDGISTLGAIKVSGCDLKQDERLFGIYPSLVHRVIRSPAHTLKYLVT